MSIEGQGLFFTIYFPGFVCFVLYWAKISGERLQDHWSSGFILVVWEMGSRLYFFFFFFFFGGGGGILLKMGDSLNVKILISYSARMGDFRLTNAFITDLSISISPCKPHGIFVPI